ncbi:acetyl-coenzyme-A carboxylase, variant 2 [Entomophthora muscae]|uniref:Acetyl-coenzyme-A carboxylase, variant 2 n=1 Tax=Entomophthora muscae TaxID=34485 RepID=A0ACC2TVR4_9FUNG|nr:acetyl-coenzyme-A carboxylase, variant 2 [Entomophthora muscae]
MVFGKFIFLFVISSWDLNICFHYSIRAGWGHASENPRLPESLQVSKNRAVFIGPPGSAMRSLGDKISSTIVAQSANVPTLGWSGSHVSDTIKDEQGFITVPAEAYAQACVSNAEEGFERARSVGYPIMIKASEGGGGKGIRKVEDEEMFAQCYSQVEKEVPGSPIFIMKLAGNSRHLEVQLLADQYGNAISIFGRDCSVQRRHQKIIEEAPVTIAKPETFEQMEKAAVRLAKLVGYVSAGTVEYLYSHSDDKFYFLELNPRLQVEHPTTEMVSGVNLPAAQLQVAMGIPLHRIRDVRLLYGMAPNASNEIDYDFASPKALQVQRKPMPQGHVIAVRITAENPDAGFKPSGGVMQELNFRSNTNVWGYFSVSSNGGLHEFADSQFGHIFAFGENRQQSRKNMVVALKELSIRGDFRTTVEYLIRLLETNEFTNNTINTGWLDTLISNKLTAERPDTTLAILCGACYKAHTACQQLRNDYKASVLKGQVLSKDTLKTTFYIEFIYEGMRYNFAAIACGPNLYNLYINGSKAHIEICDLSDGGYLLLLDGRSHSMYCREEVGSSRIMIDGKTCLLEQENDPTQLRSPSPGKLMQFMVESGDHVNAGQAYAEIEVMKMCMPLIATESGTVQFIKQPGSTLEAGDILGILSLDDPSRVRHAVPYTGQIPAFGTPRIQSSKVHQRLRDVIQVINWTLNGYDNQAILQNIIKALFELLRSPELPYLELNEALASLSGRIPASVEADLHRIADESLEQRKDFPVAQLRKVIDDQCRAPQHPADLTKFLSAIVPVSQVLENYAEGLSHHEKQVVHAFLDKYYQVEYLFDNPSTREEEAVLQLRDIKKDAIDDVVETVLSHSRVANKNSLVLTLLSLINFENVNGQTDSVYSPVLKKLASLGSRATSVVALKAREMLIHSQLPSYEERYTQMHHILLNSVTESFYGGGQGFRPPSYDALKDLVVTNFNVEDVLQNFFFNPNEYVRGAALEVYARRSYHAYEILETIHHCEEDKPALLEWNFTLQDYSMESLKSSGLLTQSKRVASMSDLSYMVQGLESLPVRKGVMFALDSISDLAGQIDRALAIYPEDQKPAEDRFSHILSIAIRNMPDTSDSKSALEMRTILVKYSAELRKKGIRRVSFIGLREGKQPAVFTFRERDDFDEDKTVRHIEPATAYQLELSRLSNFNITPCFVESRQLHVYYATGKDSSADQRFFIRALVRPGRLRSSTPTQDFLISEGDRLLGDILDSLELLLPTHPKCDCNQIFVSFIPTFALEPEEVTSALQEYIMRHGKRLWRLRVTGAEVRFTIRSRRSEGPSIFRFMINNVSGYVPTVEIYSEIKNQEGVMIFKSMSGAKASLHLQPVLTPYQPKEWLQPKRYSAHIMGTTYVYDFPELFRQALSLQWQQYSEQNPTVTVPGSVLTVKELVLDENREPQELVRPPGANNCGMVAWIFELLTPECPSGRKVVVIANDITYKIGSFGPEEDEVFFKASQLARKLGIPRIYLSANSGARIGLAEEVKSLFKIKWSDPTDPSRGMEYLYLTPDDYRLLNGERSRSVNAQLTTDEGEERYIITDIIGKTNGLGVESLRGSGMIAGETSRAYEDIFTLTVVSCRSVGIGAYLVRLGHRTIQNEGQPIILTGAPALNKVLGREVYSSNLQLGGTQIMYKNGISHTTAENDMDAIDQTLNWLSYVPECKDAPLPILPPNDPIDRKVEVEPTKGAQDPREWIAGRPSAENPSTWMGGFFDQGSFTETLSGWARTVITGRARLGGIPVGVIAVETRTVEHIIPADPANQLSEEQTMVEAGQVWYPNSAFKTAQAIKDFNNGEQLPLIIFANWRGFSGGQRDMYNEILKYGSYIVDALTQFKQPVFVYIVPNGELRGGAWVVLDPTINPEMMEMYADVKSRAGVLEPEGIVEIKFRKPQLLATIERLDTTYIDLKARLAAVVDETERQSILSQIKQREELLLPIYTQAAVQFADLHDRSGRMLAKGTIRKELTWSDSRAYFYWRLRRRLAEEGLYKSISKLCPKLTRAQLQGQLKQWCTAESGAADYENDDAAVSKFLANAPKDAFAKRLSRVISDSVAEDLLATSKLFPQAAMEGFVKVFESLSPEARKNTLQRLAQSNAI